MLQGAPHVTLYLGRFMTISRKGSLCVLCNALHFLFRFAHHTETKCCRWSAVWGVAEFCCNKTYIFQYSGRCSDNSVIMCVTYRCHFVVSTRKTGPMIVAGFETHHKLKAMLYSNIPEIILHFLQTVPISLTFHASKTWNQASSQSRTNARSISLA